jgi:hypothetical protein
VSVRSTAKKTKKQKVKLVPPDWNSYSWRSTPEKIEDLPKPWVRKFPRPDGKKRTATITLMTWVGTAMGASHIHTTAKVEDNPVWDGRPWYDDRAGGWVHFYTDKEYDGMSYHGYFPTKRAALAWARALIADELKEFETKIVDNVGSFDNKKHLYARDGD